MRTTKVQISLPVYDQHLWCLGTSHLLPGGGGGRLYSGGGGSEFFFGDVLGGGENKKPLGQGGHIFHQVFGGVRCVPLVFAFIKNQSPPPPPPISQMILPTISNIQKK